MDAKACDVRPIRVDDALAIRRAVLNPGKRHEDCRYLRDLEPGSAHFGAFDEDRLVGVASLYQEAPPHERLLSSWRIRDMAVVEVRRGQGFGTALLAACVARAESQHGEVLWCYARDTGVDFYSARGFEAVGGMSDVPGLGRRVLMVRRLPAARFLDRENHLPSSST